MDDTWWVTHSQLDAEQRKALILDPDESHFVTGPPGSGKTNLLILRSKHLLKEKASNLLVIVFTRPLEEFIKNCPSAYRIPADVVRTSQRLIRGLLREFGLTASHHEDFDEQRRENAKALIRHLKRERTGKLYDHFLLDECQDFLAEEIELFFSLAKTVFAVGDKRQQIYGAADGFEKLAKRCQILRLPFHYRNGRRICIAADHISETWPDHFSLVESSQYNESSLPSSVTFRRDLSAQQQWDELLKALEVQLLAYPRQILGVLAPTHKELKVAANILRGSKLAPSVVVQDSDEKYQPFTPETRICLTSMHGSKGLEFRTVHLVNAERIGAFRSLQKKAMYTAITRAKTALTIYGCDKVSDTLRAACEKANAVSKEVSIESLFTEE